MFTAESWPPISRGSISLLFALVQGEGVSARRRRMGFEGWGHHLRGGPATRAKQHFALTHPSNLRENRMCTGVRSRHSRGKSDARARMMRPGAGRVHGPIPEERLDRSSPARTLVSPHLRVENCRFEPIYVAKM